MNKMNLQLPEHAEQKCWIVLNRAEFSFGIYQIPFKCSIFFIFFLPLSLSLCFFLPFFAWLSLLHSFTLSLLRDGLRRRQPWTNGDDGKVKLSLCLTKHHSMKTYCGSGGIVPQILDLGTRWRWVVSFMPRPLYPRGKSPWYPLDRRLGGPQSRSGRDGEKHS
jgi:hypothetical protein